MTEKNTDLFDPKSMPTVDIEDVDKQIIGGFTPHIILTHPQSTVVKEKKVEEGHFFCSDIDLGDSFIGVFVASRWQAYLKKNGFKDIESFDIHSDTTKKVRATRTNMSAGIESKSGLAFLVYLPEQEMFAIYHFNTPTAEECGKTINKFITPLDKRKRESDRHLPYTKIVELKAEYVQKGVRNPFYKPKCDSKPMDYFDGKDLSLPPKDKLEEEMKRFYEPTLVKEEEVTSEEANER